MGVPRKSETNSIQESLRYHQVTYDGKSSPTIPPQFTILGETRKTADGWRPQPTKAVFRITGHRVKTEAVRRSRFLEARTYSGRASWTRMIGSRRFHQDRGLELERVTSPFGMLDGPSTFPFHNTPLVSSPYPALFSRLQRLPSARRLVVVWMAEEEKPRSARLHQKGSTTGKQRIPSHCR